MGTRCVISFKGPEAPTFHVYQHWDGNPETVTEILKKTLKLSWELPRYENDEFAASFIATAKTGSGNIRLTTGPEHHGDLEYRYEVSQSKDGKLSVEAFEAISMDFDKDQQFKSLGVTHIG